MTQKDSVEAEKRCCACAEAQGALRQSSRGETALFQAKLAKTKDRLFSGTAGEPTHSFQTGIVQPGCGETRR